MIMILNSSSEAINCVYVSRYTFINYLALMSALQFLERHVRMNGMVVCVILPNGPFILGAAVSLIFIEKQENCELSIRLQSSTKWMMIEDRFVARDPKL